MGNFWIRFIYKYETVNQNTYNCDEKRKEHNKFNSLLRFLYLKLGYLYDHKLFIATKKRRNKGSRFTSLLCFLVVKTGMLV